LDVFSAGMRTDLALASFRVLFDFGSAAVRSIACFRNPILEKFNAPGSIILIPAMRGTALAATAASARAVTRTDWYFTVPREFTS
jgi:hypothetical protein